MGEAGFWGGKEGVGRVRVRVPSTGGKDGWVRGKVGRLRCDAGEENSTATCG